MILTGCTSLCWFRIIIKFFIESPTTLNKTRKIKINSTLAHYIVLLRIKAGSYLLGSPDLANQRSSAKLQCTLLYFNGYWVMLWKQWILVNLTICFHNNRKISKMKTFCSDENIQISNIYIYIYLHIFSLFFLTILIFFLHIFNTH